MKKKVYSSLAILISGIILVWAAANIHWGKENWKGILENDAKGYYAYLPAVFIYKDLNFSFYDSLERKYDMPRLYYDYRASHNGKSHNKYYIGTSVLQLPFFTLAHLVTKIRGGDLDGYSKYYMLGVSMAAIFYNLLGLLFLRKLLEVYKVSDAFIAILLLACCFGTNLFIYTVSDPGMSHVYSFFLIAAFLWQAHLVFVKNQLRNVLLACMLLGFIVLVRPVNILVLFFLPFLAGSFERFKERLFQFIGSFQRMAFGLLILFSLAVIQLIAYKISTGEYLVYSYTGERFYFLKPHFWDILFSFKKGLFVYTPVYFLSLLLIVPFFRSSKYLALNWLLFFGLITYVFSSWWMWYYGGSFSSRVYIDYLSIFILVIGISYTGIKSMVQKKLLIASIIALTVLCQIQSYQYRYYIIHYSDMTFDRYWDVFLELKK